MIIPACVLRLILCFSPSDAFKAWGDWLALGSRSKAVLKSPQSRRWRVCHPLTNFAERLDCGAFTAGFRALKNLQPRVDTLGSLKYNPGMSVAHQDIKSCMLIESSSDESDEHFRSAVEDLLRDIHIIRGSPDWVGFSIGSRFERQGTQFREFVCVAGSVISLLWLRASRDGGISRAIIMRGGSLRGSLVCREIRGAVEAGFEPDELRRLG